MSGLDMSLLIDNASRIINGFWPLIAIMGGLTIGFGIFSVIDNLMHPGRVRPETPAPVIYDYSSNYEPVEWDDDQPDPAEPTSPEPARCRYCGKLFESSEVTCKSCGGNR